MKKIIDKNLVKTQTASDDGEGGLIIQTSQDVTDIVEKNKKEYNATNGTWGGDLFDNKIASIPMTVIDDLNKKGIMKGFHVVDQKKFRLWLNDPDNRFFRTRQGRI